MSTRNQLKIDRHDDGSTLQLTLEGDMNETFTPEMVTEGTNDRHLIINLRGVARITSYGVRQWVRAMRVFAEKSVRSITLEQCSYAFVSQLNTIKGLNEGAYVRSVEAPMACESCNHELKLVLDLGDGSDRDAARPCPNCGKQTLTLDEDPDSFFVFARDQKAPPTPVTTSATPQGSNAAKVVSGMAAATELSKSNEPTLVDASAVVEVGEPAPALASAEPAAEPAKAEPAVEPAAPQTPGARRDLTADEIAQIAAVATSTIINTLVDSVSYRLNERIERLTRRPQINPAPTPAAEPTPQPPPPAPPIGNLIVALVAGLGLGLGLGLLLH